MDVFIGFSVEKIDKKTLGTPDYLLKKNRWMCYKGFCKKSKQKNFRNTGLFAEEKQMNVFIDFSVKK